MEGMEVHLDLRKVKLYGYQQGVYDRVVFSITRGISLGDSFPAVPVRRVNESTYELTKSHDAKGEGTDYRWKDGGHHRAAAHFLAGKPLKCKIVTDQAHFIDPTERVDISEIELLHDNNGNDYKLRKSVFHIYR